MSLAELFPAPERMELMQKGIGQLRLWLDDLLRLGMLEYDFSEEALQEMAGRMVDAKLGGVARRIRLLNTLDKSDPDWSKHLLHILSQLYLLTLSFDKLETLSPVMQLTILSQAGLNLKKDQLPRSKALTDTWVVVGQYFEQQEQLRLRRTWLSGLQSRRIAMILDFVWGRNQFEVDFTFHRAYKGKLIYYPSSFPIRGLLLDVRSGNRPPTGIPAYAGIDHFLDQYAQAVARNPWLMTFPAPIQIAGVVYRQGIGYVHDDSGKGIRFGGSEQQAWALQAIGGGKPVTLFGEWNGFAWTPLAWLEEGKMVAFDA